jgi:hypothetical protein
VSEFYDKDGTPLTLEQWGEKHHDRQYCQIGFDEFGVYAVSTVWIGIDHNFARLWDPTQPPLIFESAVINRGETHTHKMMPGVIFHGIEITERYSTLEQALAGHQALCDKVRGAVYS